MNQPTIEDRMRDLIRETSKEVYKIRCERFLKEFYAWHDKQLVLKAAQECKP